MTGEIYPEGIKFTEDPSIPDGYVSINGQLFPLTLDETGYVVGLDKQTIAMTEDMSRLEEIAGIMWDSHKYPVPWEYIVETKHLGWRNDVYNKYIAAAEKVRSLVRKQDRA